MRRLFPFLAITSFLISFSSYGNVLTAYYGPNGVKELSSGHQADQELRKTVERFAKKNRIKLGYTTAKKHLFGEIFLEKDGSSYVLKDVYCRRTLRSDEGWKIGPMTIPPNGEVNCEHTWPQSRFNTSLSKASQKSDLYHLFPTDSKANGVRGNYPFAEVHGQIAHKSCTSSTIGSALEPMTDVNTRTRFYEPPVEHRGNVARAIFYFSVVYHLPIDHTEETYLRRWNDEDPVDAVDKMRHNLIMEVQGNRNPFIDYPNLVQRISDF